MKFTYRPEYRVDISFPVMLYLMIANFCQKQETNSIENNFRGECDTLDIRLLYVIMSLQIAMDFPRRETENSALLKSLLGVINCYRTLLCPFIRELRFVINTIWYFPNPEKTQVEKQTRNV